MTQRWAFALVVISGALFGLSDALPVQSQSEQSVEVVIKDSTFVTKQAVLRLGVPTIITLRNEDGQRHDFGSTMFEGIPTKSTRTASVCTAGDWVASCWTRSAMR